MSLRASTLARSERADRAARVDPRRFRPRLNFGYYQDLQALIRDLDGRDFDGRVRCLRASIDTAEARRVQLRQLGVGDDDLQPTVFYLATLGPAVAGGVPGRLRDG